MSVSTHAGEDLAWLTGILWPDPDTVRATVEPTPAPGYRRRWSFAVVPSLRAPVWVVSTDRGAGRAAFFRFNGAMSTWARARKVAAGVAFETGLGPAIVRDRLHLDVADGADADALAETSIGHHLARALGLGRVGLCISFGTMRPNRKPVVQVIGPGGSAVGFAKIAWNDLTERLVVDEARALDDLAARPPRSFLAPAVIHRGSWQGRSLIVTSPIPASFRAPGRSAMDVAVREIAERAGVDRMPITEAPSVRDAFARAQQLPPDRTTVVGDAIAAFRDRVAEVDVRVGSWHGDWAPWNVSRSGSRLGVYDWERSRTGVPVGLDAVHLAVQVALRRTAGDVAAAVRLARSEAASPLAAMGVAPGSREAVLEAYEVELLLRFEEAVAEGVISPSHPLRHDLVTLLMHPGTVAT